MFGLKIDTSIDHMQFSMTNRAKLSHETMPCVFQKAVEAHSKLGSTDRNSEEETSVSS